MATWHASIGKRCCDHSGSLTLNPRFDPACAQESSEPRHRILGPCCGQYGDARRIFPISQDMFAALNEARPCTAGETIQGRAIEHTSGWLCILPLRLYFPAAMYTRRTRMRGTTATVASIARNCRCGSTPPSRSDTQALGSASRSPTGHSHRARRS
jgi:hypothetical protein